MLSLIRRPLTCAGNYLSRASSTQRASKIQRGDASKAVFDKDDKYGAHIFNSIPVAINKGQGDVSHNIIILHW